MVRTYNTKALALLIGCLLVGSQSTLKANSYLYQFSTIYKPVENVGGWLGAKSITAFNFIKGLCSATTVSSETKNIETKVELKDINPTEALDTKVQSDSFKIYDKFEEKSSLLDTWNDISGGDKALFVGGVCLVAGAAKVVWNNYSIHCKLNKYQEIVDKVTRDKSKINELTSEQIISILKFLSCYTDAPLKIQQQLKSYKAINVEAKKKLKRFLFWAIDKERFDNRINLNISILCSKLNSGNIGTTIKESNTTEPDMFDYLYCSLGKYWSAPILWKRLNARATQLYYEYTKLYVEIAGQNKK